MKQPHPGQNRPLVIQHAKFVFAVLLVFQLVMPLGAQMRKVDSRFISEKACFVLQLDIQEILKHEKMGSKDLEAIRMHFKKHGKFDINNLKTVKLQFGVGDDPSFDDGNEIVGAVIEFSRPVDQKDFLTGFGIPEFEESTLNGYKTFQSKRGVGPIVCFPDEKNIVLASKESLGSLLNRDKGDSKIAGLLNSAAPGCEVIGAFQNTGFYNEFLESIVEQVPVRPFDIQKVYSAPQTGIVQIDLDADTPLSVRLSCKQAEQAELLARKTKQLLKLAEASIPLGREAIKQQKDAFTDDVRFREFMDAQMKMVEQMLDLAEEVLEKTDVHSQGKSVRLSVQKKGGWKSIVPMISKMLANQFAAFERFEEELKRDVPDIKDDF